jgi:hypothetical protein
MRYPLTLLFSSEMGGHFGPETGATYARKMQLGGKPPLSRHRVHLPKSNVEAC